MNRGLAILLCLMLALVAVAPAASAQSNPIEQAGESVKKGMDQLATGIGDVFSSFDSDKLGRTPTRDLMTLGIGGLAGYAVGAMVSGIGIVNLDLIGIPMIPIAGVLAGLYLANEGFFDNWRKAVPVE